MEIEFQKAGVRYLKEKRSNIYYEEYVVGKDKVDFMIEEKICLEIKALSELTNREMRQGINYLESHHFEIGLLINFGAKSLQFKRLINPAIYRNINPANPNYPSKS